MQHKQNNPLLAVCLKTVRSSKLPKRFSLLNLTITFIANDWLLYYGFVAVNGRDAVNQQLAESSLVPFPTFGKMFNKSAGLILPKPMKMVSPLKTRPLRLRINLRPLIYTIVGASCISLVASLLYKLFRYSIPFYRETCVQKLVAANTWWNELNTVSFNMSENRKLFRCAKEPVVPKLHVHQHAQLAAWRMAANVFVDHFAQLIKRDVFSVSGSVSDLRTGRSNRMFFGSKDLTVPSAFKTPNPNDIIKMIDVDYYTDLSYYAQFGLPMILFTFLPGTVAGKVGEGRFYITGNEINFLVPNCSPYSHPLWKFDTDHVIFNCGLYRWVYEIEVRKFTEGHSLVFFQPIRKMYIWTFLESPLKRRSLTDGEATAQIFDTDNPYVSLMHVGRQTSVEISLKIFDDLNDKMSLVSKPTLGVVEAYLQGKVQSVTDVSIAYYAYWSKSVHRRPETLSVPATSRVFEVCGPATSENLDRPSMNNWTVSYVDDPLSIPSKTKKNLDAGVKGRTQAYQVRKEPRAHSRITNDIADFTQFVLEGATLHELTLETMIDDVTDPAQSKKLANFLEEGWDLSKAKAFFTNFMKAEAGKIAFPRLIRNPRNFFKWLYSCATRAVANFLKKKSWYAFGKTPEELAFSMNQALSSARSSYTATDFSKFDGTVSSFIRVLESHFLKEAFGGGSALEALHSSQFIPYGETGFARDSGSGETSVFNTLACAFASYRGYRVKLSPKQAYDMVCQGGRYGGDDGLNCDLDPADFVKASEQIGLVATESTIQIGAPVPFLGRYWLRGSDFASSVIDVPRMISKLHLSVQPVDTPVPNIARAKACSFLAMDSNAPFLSEWSRTVLEFTTDTKRRTNDVLEYNYNSPIRTVDLTLDRTNLELVQRLETLGYPSDLSASEWANLCWPDIANILHFADKCFAEYRVSGSSLEHFLAFPVEQGQFTCWSPEDVAEAVTTNGITNGKPVPDVTYTKKDHKAKVTQYNKMQTHLGAKGAAKKPSANSKDKPGSIPKPPKKTRRGKKNPLTKTSKSSKSSPAPPPAKKGGKAP
jgi:hypothetical protein